jgi:hypothetical protein
MKNGEWMRMMMQAGFKPVATSLPVDAEAGYADVATIEADEWIVAAPVNSRSDMATAQIVEHGIEIAKLEGIIAATQFLREKKIDPDVVERVLWRPSQRRRYSFSR